MIFNVVFGIWLFLSAASFLTGMWLVFFCKTENKEVNSFTESIGALFFISVMILTIMAIISKFI